MGDTDSEKTRPGFFVEDEGGRLVPRQQRIFLALLLVVLLVLVWRRGPPGFFSWHEKASVSPIPQDPFVLELEGPSARSGIYTFSAQVGIEAVLLRAGVSSEGVPEGAMPGSLRTGTRLVVLPSSHGLKLQVEPMDSAKKLLYGIPLDLNRVGPDDLILVPGIGPILARRIIDYRKQRGPFAQLDDLRHVSGIGGKKLDSLRPYLSVESNLPPIP
jgi:competence protein ComEA